jgi:hypothetical protein
MEMQTKLNKEEVLDWFGETKSFLDFHRANLKKHKGINDRLFLE